MKKIIDFDIYGLVPVDGGFLYIKPEMTASGKTKVGFYGYDVRSDKTVPVTKWVYLESKLGPAFKEISVQLKAYVSCDAAMLSNRHAALIYPDGDLGIFGIKGTAIWTGTLKYRGQSVCGIAPVGTDFWSVVPSLNAIVCYSTAENRVQMRIGGDNSTAFLKPEAVIKYDRRLFVSCSESCKVRAVSLDDYSVSDYLTFEEPVYKYFIAAEQEFVKLKSGIYILEA